MKRIAIFLIRVIRHFSIRKALWLDWFDNLKPRGKK